MDFADVWLWIVANKWWLFAIAPFVAAIIIVRILR